jgi:hypothetical protein
MFSAGNFTKQKVNRLNDLGEAMCCDEQASNCITNAVLYRLSQGGLSAAETP